MTAAPLSNPCGTAPPRTPLFAQFITHMFRVHDPTVPDRPGRPGGPGRGGFRVQGQASALSLGSYSAMLLLTVTHQVTVSKLQFVFLLCLM